MKTIDIVMRARNDMPLVRETLARLAEQTLPYRLIAFDNGSTDGTREALASAAAVIRDVPSGDYVPGRILNEGARLSEGEIIVYLNSDCTPQDSRWLEELVAPFEDSEVAAVFGRQIPRPGCAPLYALDTENTYGDGARQAAWRHCFSMASSAVRRSVWEAMPFSETLGYSEDIDWSWRIRMANHAVQYAPKSIVAHSHNYSWSAYYRRQYGEGKAEAAIFQWSDWQRSWLRYSLLPYGRQVVRDVRYCLAHGHFGSAVYSPALRLAQLLGRRAGFQAGMERRAVSCAAQEYEGAMIYAPSASSEFQAWFGERLRRLTDDVRQGVGDNLVALILGGGYGRGEGGVVRRNQREMPYNDIDLTIVVNEPTRVDQRVLETIGKRASDVLGIEVDFSRPVAPGDVQNWPNTLMWHDLLNGHLVLTGEPNILKRLAPPTLSEPVPATEALRLLLNRGSGLLWAMAVKRGDETPPDQDFVRRNSYKCLMALGDAVLITHNKYNTLYTGREITLMEVCSSQSDVSTLNIQNGYRAALAFKFTPDLAPPVDTELDGLRAIADAWISVLLYVERSRHRNHDWRTIDEYVAWRGIRERDQNGADRWLKNAVQNGMLGRPSVRYPRERLYRELPALLTSERENPACWAERVESYLKIWKRFN